jgi:predicted ATPase
MEREPAIRRLTIRNLLSFGEKGTTADLQNLNVLIGANGSGKSNLIEVIGLLQNAPKDLGEAIRNGGSIEEWLWKGAPRAPTAHLEAIISQGGGQTALRYLLAFTKAGFRFEIVDELIQDEVMRPDEVPIFYYSPANGRSVLNFKGERRELRQEDVNPRLSILAQRKDPDGYPEITYLGELFGKFQLYRGWGFGSYAKLREPSDVSRQGEFLEEDGSNLGVVLDRLLARPPVKDRIIESLRTFYESAKDLRTTVEGGKVQTRLEEKGLNATIPLVRMSDGTVRWIALLAILLNPDPPPLVAIEEPELGLHPDMIRDLSKLLIEASARTQVIITTHSTQLIEEFSERPEAVIVCEKENGESNLERLDAQALSAWLKEYNLGQLWANGQLGGNRW